MSGVKPAGPERPKEEVVEPVPALFKESGFQHGKLFVSVCTSS